ncbi:MAG: pyruvate dehydrogenase (acetyl-transferring) E1 component subunit alpha [Alphaproteobacteria bacterium]
MAPPKPKDKPEPKGKRGSSSAASGAQGAPLLEFYREMLLIRRFEEKAGQLYGMGLVGGFCHLYIGQEAVAVGMMSAVTPQDVVITSYRDHGHMLARGMDPGRVMAELTGRADGYSKGKGGSMHMFSRKNNFMGGHGIVGAQVPMGTGIAFALDYRHEAAKGPRLVSLTFLGDGAVNQGQVYESFNMAALWRLPVVYVIENNQYGMGTSVDRASASPELFRRGEAYDIPGERIDGMDVIEVAEAAARAVGHGRAGKGPYILEMMTYRYRGHSMSDPAKYRPKEEVERVRSHHDPIDLARARLLETKAADEEALKELDREVKEIVAKAAEFAQQSPEPDPSELLTDVVVEV